MSKIEVNTVDTQCGTNLTVGSACKSVTVAGNDIRSNAYKAGDGGNIVSQSGTNITLGASGDTVSLASGASQSGFGRTGTVDWQTGSIKTSDFTAANGEGYFVNTTSGAVTATLPSSPSAGNIVAIADYAGTAGTNNITIARNGSNIEGQANNGVISSNRDTITLVFVDATQGWLAVNDNESSFIAPTFITATGGTITTSGDCKIHTFTGPGTFCVSQISNTPANNEVSYVVVAGGGGGGQGNNGPSQRTGGGGGGAGGYRETKSPVAPYSASPLDGYSTAPNRITLTATGFPITVGSGGTGSNPGPAGKGSNSVFSTITSTGGGGGKGDEGPAGNVGPGGSGRAAATETDGSAVPTGGAGNDPATTPPQGNPGSGSPGNGGGGGGGAGAAGTYNDGGAGVASSITASPVQRAGGGGGGGPSSPGGASFGGGAGGTGSNAGTNGTANTGGGGGGAGGSPSNTSGSTGGSGIVIIRYKFQ